MDVLLGCRGAHAADSELDGQYRIELDAAGVAPALRRISMGWRAPLRRIGSQAVRSAKIKMKVMRSTPTILLRMVFARSNKAADVPLLMPTLPPRSFKSTAHSASTAHSGVATAECAVHFRYAHRPVRIRSTSSFTVGMKPFE